MYEQVYSPERFKQVSTVIIDYNMPGINGLEVCAKIENPHIQKILFTGAADENLAVKAFNEGLIQGFIRKHDPQVTGQLEKMIQRAQEKFFLSISKIYMTAVTSDPEKTFLLQPSFIELFTKIVQENSITEYYLRNFSGHFLFLNAHGNPSALFTFKGEIIDMLNGDLLNQIDVETAKDPHLVQLIEDMKERRKTVSEDYFEHVQINNPLEWPQYSYVLNSLPGIEDCYWYYMPYKESLRNVVSFADFQRQS